MYKVRKITIPSESIIKTPALLERFPDIDYEMIPISPSDKMLTKRAGLFSNKQYSKLTVKKIRTVKYTNLTILYSLEKNHLAFFKNFDLILLLSFNQIKRCKKTKKHTKIYLKNGEVLKTQIKFKKLKKCLTASLKN